jgi:hypothetical protein
VPSALVAVVVAAEVIPILFGAVPRAARGSDVGADVAGWREVVVVIVNVNVAQAPRLPLPSTRDVRRLVAMIASAAPAAAGGARVGPL